MKSASDFAWPAGKRAAVSLTFDDARVTQADAGFSILDEHAVRGTFYVMVGAVRKRLDRWQAAIARGHEIGNHTLTHPCSGNFVWAQKNPLEDYSLERMEQEILGASAAIADLLGVRPATFAYPCGQTFVGRGENVRSYVPLVAKHFIAGRGFNAESATMPGFCDLAQVCGVGLDALSIAQARAWIDRAIEQQAWLVFVGHEVGDGGAQTVLRETLEAVCRYCMDESNGIWIDRVTSVAEYIRQLRSR